MRLAGSVVVLLGEDDLLEAFEKAAPFTRQEIDDYAADLRATNAISDIERAYGDLITSSDMRFVRLRHHVARRRPAFKAAARVIRNAPEVTHCPGPDCVRCRDSIAGGQLL